MNKLIIDGLLYILVRKSELAWKAAWKLTKYCRSKAGNIALDVARSYGNEQIVELLIFHYNIEMLISFIN